MDNGALLNYALKRRNFLVAMWLTLQQRWFVRSFNLSARVLSWMVIALGMTLVTLTVVTIARNVVPVLTTPGTLQYYLLQQLVLVVSFNIYVNYFCATAFSRRVGKAPAEYVYRDPYGADPNERPVDDSNESESEEDSEDEDATNEESVAVSGTVHPLYRTQSPFQPWQHRTTGTEGEVANNNSSSPTAETVTTRESTADTSLSAEKIKALPVPQHVNNNNNNGGGGGGLPPLVPTGPSLRNATTSPAPKRVGGIQIVRVFGEEPPTNRRGNTRSGEAWSGSTVVTVPSGATEDGMEMDAGEAREADRMTRSPSFCCSNHLGLCLGRCWRRLCPGKGTRVCRTSSHRCTKPVGRCLGSTVTCGEDTASMNVLRELESLAFAAEHFGPRQRAFRTLDTPRRYCSHCRRLKAPREHHCAICNECVAKMDHHCPWINNCVDVENQRYFILFIGWLWFGTLLAAGFIGYGVVRQRRYTDRRDTLFKRWLRSPAKAALAAELQELHMPYGPSGVLLTSFPTVMVLGLSITMCLCMTFFLYMNRHLVLENTTVIESIYVDEKRHHVYRSTGFFYRNPYDLGRWWNFLDMFSPAGDPLVRRATETLRSSATQPSTAGAHLRSEQPPQRRQHPRWWLNVTAVLRGTAVALWLTSFPTFRPTHSDGVHYTTFDALAAGEQTSLLRS